MPERGDAKAPVHTNPRDSAGGRNVQEWISGLKTRPASYGKAAARQFQVKHCGPIEYLVVGRNSRIWADGVNSSNGDLCEAKYVTDPKRSPFIPGSSIPEHIRSNILLDVESELARYSFAVNDSSLPCKNLVLFTNHGKSQEFFRGRMSAHSIKGRVERVD